MKEILFITSSFITHTLVLIDRIETAMNSVAKSVIHQSWTWKNSRSRLCRRFDSDIDGNDVAVSIRLFFDIKNNDVKEEVNFDDDSWRNRELKYRIQ